MRYFTSDLHFGHHNIIEFCSRPWAHVWEMNAGMIRKYNDVVTDEDEVWFVGDIAMGLLKDTVPYAKQLNGHKILVPGNHDRCHPMYPAKKRDIKLYEDAGFTIMDIQQVIEIEGRPVRVCHFPYKVDYNIPKEARRSEDRFSGLRPDDDGSWLICGHVHDAWQIRDKQINVGVDVWDFKPVSEEKIAEIIREAEAA